MGGKPKPHTGVIIQELLCLARSTIFIISGLVLESYISHVNKANIGVEH